MFLRILRRLFSESKILLPLSIGAIIFILFFVILSSSVEGKTARINEGNVTELLENEPSFEQRVLEVSEGDTLGGILEKAGVPHREALESIQAMKEIFNPSHLRPGNSLELKLGLAEEVPLSASLKELKIVTDIDREIVVRHDQDYGYVAKEVIKEFPCKSVAAAGVIQSSLYSAATQAGTKGISQNILMQFINAFSFDVDFQRDIRQGDSFEVLYETYVDENGVSVKDGKLLYGCLTVQGSAMKVYLFTSQEGEEDYYHEDGRSVRKTLIRTPINGAHLSFTYGKQQHPIYGYSYTHKGLDFAAPVGTPIMAAGTGTVEFVGYTSGYGNHIILRHTNGYKTLYAHMSSYAKGMEKGARVQQGDTIGYVGATGLTTGPHLHYEVIYQGVQINPATVKFPPGKKLSEEDVERFFTEKTVLDREYRSAYRGSSR